MKDLWSTISTFYSGTLRPEAIYVVDYLANNLPAVVILIAVIIILSVIRAKMIKNAKWQQFVDFVCGMIAVLLMIVAWYSFSPSLNKYMNFFPSSSSIKSTTTPGTTTQPSSSSHKQLYYSVGCYNCYADSCVRNGYSYGGYDVTYYNYIRNLCRSCSCSSYRAQSLWR